MKMIIDGIKYEYCDYKFQLEVDNATPIFDMDGKILVDECGISEVVRHTVMIDRSGSDLETEKKEKLGTLFSDCDILGIHGPGHQWLLDPVVEEQYDFYLVRYDSIEDLKHLFLTGYISNRKFYFPILDFVNHQKISENKVINEIAAMCIINIIRPTLKYLRKTMGGDGVFMLANDLSSWSWISPCPDERVAFSPPSQDFTSFLMSQ